MPFAFCLLAIYSTGTHLLDASVSLDIVGSTSINGYIVEWGGMNYNLIFLVTPIFFLLAILCMSQVTKGEAR